jgi:plastocyanin
MKKYLLSFLLVFSTIYSLPANSLTISPAEVSVKPGKSVNFSVSGNIGNDLRWLVVKGNVRELPGVVMGENLEIHEGGTSVSYIAPFEAGSYSLAVTDGKAMAIAQILVNDLQNAIMTMEILGGNRELSVGAQQALSLQAVLADLTQQDKTKAAKWKTSDDSIVAVDNEGVITAKAAGKAKITATIGDQSAEIEITVQAENATGLAVDPETVYLATGNKQTIVITKIFKSGNKQEVDAAACELTSSSDAVTVNKTELEAVSQGYASIKVKCDDLQSQVVVFVNSALALETSPESLTLRAGASDNFSISGGVAPYTVTADKGRVNGNSGHWNYIAAANANNDTITVTDQDGTTVMLSVKISQGLILSPQSIDLAANTTENFTVASGLAPYTWQVTAGILNKMQGTEVIYTAPQTKGVYEISVVDQQGDVKRAVINVGGDLIASPQQLILNPDEEQKFYITGGTKPYKISASSGTYTEDDDGNFYYTAPSVAGDYNLTIKDKENKSTNINVSVQSKLAVTPLELFLKRNEEAELNISGGYGKYTVTAKTGDVKENKSTYKAANVAGRDLISITDQAGAVVQVEVLVSLDGFYVSPGESYILPGETVKLRGLGGTAPYTWTVKGEGDLSKNEGERVTFTAPKVAGKYTIVIKGNSGKETEATVIVYQGELKLSPEILVIAPDKTAELTALLGVPDYVWSNDQVGALSATKGKTVTYTASDKQSEDIIQLEDATGKLKTLRVVIQKGKLNMLDLIAGADGKVDEAEMGNALIYAGADGKVDEAEMNKAIDDFFAGQA